MKLHQHPEFEDALSAAADDMNVDVRFVEKDYYVTETLRIATLTHPDRTIFKGGTSLSKGWQITERFSEDIDLFFDPEFGSKSLSKRAIDRELKRLRDAVGDHPGLTYIKGEGQTIGGFGREDYFSYDSRFEELPGVRPAVLLEPGIQSGNQPTEVVELSSLVGQYLINQGNDDMGDDLNPFAMTLLHFRRTFVEKLFTVHGKIERLKETGEPLGRHARHYADLHDLAGRDEIDRMLRSSEYGAIKKDYDQRSRRFFPKSYRPPADLTFSGSDGVFLPGELRERVNADYEAECNRLFPRSYPTLDQAIARLENLQSML